MTFTSILFEKPEDKVTNETVEAPPCFIDLNLDQVINAITAGREEYNLKPFFFTSLNTIDGIRYRHGVMQDLENEVLFEQIKAFAQKMRKMREHLLQAGKLHHQYQKESWFLDAVEIYCDAVQRLADDLRFGELKSRGLQALRDYIASYAESRPYRSLLSETKKIKADLSTVTYCLLIKGNRISVRNYESDRTFGDKPAGRSNINK